MNQTRPFELISNFDFIDGPSRIYKQGEVAVVVPDAIAAELEDVSHKHDHDSESAPLKAPLQDTIFGVLKLLPNPDLVREIIVSNHLDQSRQGLFEALAPPSVQVLDPARMVLPRTLRLSEIPKAVVDGWCRLVWLRYPFETHFFKYSLSVEPETQHTDAAVTDFEKFALHTVHKFFLSSDREFIKFITEMPLSAVTLAETLRRTCDDDGTHDNAHIRGCIHKIETLALPAAQKKLLTLIKELREDDDIHDVAVKLLVLTGTAEQLATLQTRSLDLSHEPLNGSYLSRLAYISTLERLNLSQSTLTREGTGFLKDLPNLKQLNLSNTQIMSSSLNSIRGAQHLEELDLSGTAVNESILAILPKITTLRRVNVTDTDLPNVEDLRTALPGCLVVG